MKDFEITEEAKRFLFEIAERKRPDCLIRLTLSPGACSWPSFDLNFDKKMVNDVAFKSGGLTFLIDHSLLQEAKPIKIDYSPNTPGAKFTMVSNLNLATTCWGCSTDCKNDFTGC